MIAEVKHGSYGETGGQAESAGRIRGLAGSIGGLEGSGRLVGSIVGSGELAGSAGGIGSKWDPQGFVGAWEGLVRYGGQVVSVGWGGGSGGWMLSPPPPPGTMAIYNPPFPHKKTPPSSPTPLNLLTPPHPILTYILNSWHWPTLVKPALGVACRMWGMAGLGGGHYLVWGGGVLDCPFGEGLGLKIAWCQGECNPKTGASS